MKMLAAPSSASRLHSPFLYCPLKLSTSSSSRKTLQTQRSPPSYPCVRAADLDQNTVNALSWFCVYYICDYSSFVEFLDYLFSDNSNNSWGCKRCSWDWNSCFLWEPNWQCCRFSFYFFPFCWSFVVFIFVINCMWLCEKNGIKLRHLMWCWIVSGQKR